jgi:hypothetical protein
MLNEEAALKIFVPFAIAIGGCLPSFDGLTGGAPPREAGSISPDAVVDSNSVSSDQDLSAMVCLGGLLHRR